MYVIICFHIFTASIFRKTGRAIGVKAKIDTFMLMSNTKKQLIALECKNRP